MRAANMQHMAIHKVIVISFILALYGCASVEKQAQPISSLPEWMQDTIAYKETLPADHPDDFDALFAISDEMRQTVVDKFSRLPSRARAGKIANWMVDEDGLNMKYDLDANFSPIEAYAERKGNCLSFTILLSVLAAELDVEVKYNLVDLPDAWAMNEQNGMLLYRHINGSYRNAYGRQIFDLAIENYDFGYPQRTVSAEFVAAKLHSNRAVNAFYKDDRELAFHYIMLAISTDPENSDLWNNMGAMLKRSGDMQKAEQAFLHSQALDHSNGVAASNLEKFYRELGNQKKSATYADIALKARKTNPYYHYYEAQKLFDKEEYAKARKFIRKAQKLHDKDPRFFELSSLILQGLKKYPQAFKELEKAYELAATSDEKQRYYSKAERVAQLAAQYQPRTQNVTIPGNLLLNRGF